MMVPDPGRRITKAVERVTHVIQLQMHRKPVSLMFVIKY